MAKTYKIQGYLVDANGDDSNTLDIKHIDNSYASDTDIWGFPALAMRDTVIEAGDRICQFRIMPIMGSVQLTQVEYLTGKARGGFGSTGTN